MTAFKQSETVRTRRRKRERAGRRRKKIRRRADKDERLVESCYDTRSHASDVRVALLLKVKVLVLIDAEMSITMAGVQYLYQGLATSPGRTRPISKLEKEDKTFLI